MFYKKLNIPSNKGNVNLQIKQLYKAVVKESQSPFTKYRHSSKNDIKRG